MEYHPYQDPGGNYLTVTVGYSNASLESSVFQELGERGARFSTRRDTQVFEAIRGRRASTSESLSS